MAEGQLTPDDLTHIDDMVERALGDIERKHNLPRYPPGEEEEPLVQVAMTSLGEAIPVMEPQDYEDGAYQIALARPPINFNAAWPPSDDPASMQGDGSSGKLHRIVPLEFGITFGPEGGSVALDDLPQGAPICIRQVGCQRILLKKLDDKWYASACASSPPASSTASSNTSTPATKIIPCHSCGRYHTPHPFQ